RDFIRCPSCLRKLKERCVSCSRPLDQAWTICPYCETDVPGASTSRRARRRRAPVESDRSEIAQHLIENEAPLAVEEDRSDIGQTATGASGEGARAPIAAPEPASRPRSAGRASRPRPTS